MKDTYNGHKLFDFETRNGLLISKVYHRLNTDFRTNIYVFIKNNVIHREDGPAHISEDGVSWFLNDRQVNEEMVFNYAVKNKNVEAVKSIIWKKYLDEEWDF